MNEENNSTTAVLDRKEEVARLWATVPEASSMGDDYEDSEVDTRLGDEVETEETPEETPAQPEAKPEETVETTEEEQAYQQFMDEWKRDPVNLMQHLMTNLTPEQMQRLGVGQVTEEAGETLPDDYVPASVLEENLLPHMEWVTQGQDFVQKNFVSREDMGAYHDYLTQSGVLLNDAQARVHLLEAQLEALQTVVGQTLPKADMKAIQAELSKGVTYQDAVEKVYKGELDKAIKTAKQAGRQRPQTPGNESNAMEDIPQGAKMSEILRKMGIN